MTLDGHSYEFHIQMETSGRIDCGIFAGQAGSLMIQKKPTG